MDVVILTAYPPDEEMEMRLSGLRKRNRSVTVHLLQNREGKK
jgi:hypothetical protein